GGDADRLHPLLEAALQAGALVAGEVESPARLDEVDQLLERPIGSGHSPSLARFHVLRIWGRLDRLEQRAELLGLARGLVRLPLETGRGGLPPALPEAQRDAPGHPRALGRR